ncbi:MAG: 2-phospho-L-lactate transferase [Actinomycetota bacterium]
MKIVALAGGVGAGKFLRGLVRVVPPSDVTVVVNTGDDLTIHGLRVCPDIDSVTYWLAGVADRERGWGRADESFRAMEQLEKLGGQAWFSLGDMDLGTHLARLDMLSAGSSLSAAVAAVARALAVDATILPMSEDDVTTRVEAVGRDGEKLDLHFQEYWVGRRASDDVKAITYLGATSARPAPGVIEAIRGTDTVLICPSNPVASIGPILAIPGILEAVRGRRVVGISPIVAGAPIAGMADRLMPVAGLEVSAYGAASAYRDLATAFVIDEQDAALATRIEMDLGIRVGVTDTIMTDDAAAERVARVALELAT